MLFDRLSSSREEWRQKQCLFLTVSSERRRCQFPPFSKERTARPWGVRGTEERAPMSSTRRSEKQTTQLRENMKSYGYCLWRIFCWHFPFDRGRSQEGTGHRSRPPPPWGEGILFEPILKRENQGGGRLCWDPGSSQGRFRFLSHAVQGVRLLGWNFNNCMSSVHQGVSQNVFTCTSSKGSFTHAGKMVHVCEIIQRLFNTLD